ncbi:MAG: PEPxxWA-CTERM sorting domain-containing protein [Phenylobacterium sp.]
MKKLLAAAAVAAVSVAGAAHADATLVGSYLFNNTLTSSVAGAPTLTLTDPLGTSGFVTDSVFGQNRTVLHIGGAASPVLSQGGLTFNNTGNLVTPDNYSIALSLKFESGQNAWRRIIDVENRQSDNGFYVDPGNVLDVYPVTGAVPFTNNTYQNVILTVGTGGDVNAYLQGVSGSLHATTTVMNINNPQNFINLFLDNVVGGGQGEWSPADIAVAAFYNGVLSQAQIAAFSVNPVGAVTPPSNGVPEPATWAMMLVGFAGLGALLRRRRAGLAFA